MTIMMKCQVVVPKNPFSPPADLDQPFGIIITFSDVGGFDEQKVVGYVTGTDQAGISIKNGGDTKETTCSCIN